MHSSSCLTAAVALCCVVVLCSGATPEHTGTSTQLQTLTLGGSRKPQQQHGARQRQRQRRDGNVCVCVCARAHRLSANKIKCVLSRTPVTIMPATPCCLPVFLGLFCFNGLYEARIKKRKKKEYTWSEKSVYVSPSRAPPLSPHSHAPTQHSMSPRGATLAHSKRGVCRLHSCLAGFEGARACVPCVCVLVHLSAMPTNLVCVRTRLRFVTHMVASFVCRVCCF